MWSPVNEPHGFLLTFCAATWLLGSVGKSCSFERTRWNKTKDPHGRHFHMAYLEAPHSQVVWCNYWQCLAGFKRKLMVRTCGLRLRSITTWSNCTQTTIWLFFSNASKSCSNNYIQFVFVVSKNTLFSSWHTSDMKTILLGGKVVS